MERTPLSRRENNIVTPRRNRPGLCERSVKSYTPKLTPNEIKSNYTKKIIKTPACNLSNLRDTELRKINVSVRVRPPALSESGEYSNLCVSKSNAHEILVRSNQNKDTKESYLAFSYDHVFWFEQDHGSHQSDIFQTIAIPLLDSSLEGYNACLFAYGQTGSGKTYSLMDSDGHFTEDGMGVIPRFCKELIKRREICENEFTVHISYYEIYNEKIFDLLNEEVNSDNRIGLKVREHPLTGPYVSGSTSVCVDTFEQVLSLLKLGNRRRMTGATLNNERSSRSHTIFDISIKKKTHEQTKVRLVDLAGSERVSQCAITQERFKEGLSINKSLLILGKVITALAETRKKVYIPYRESLLTWLLKDSLGGNSRTCMLATVSPNPTAVDETLSTLRWAHKAQSIICAPVKNEDPQIQLIIELQNEVKRLRCLRTDMSNKSPARDSLTELEELQATLELEKQQKSAEMKLQSELAKLEMHLNEAEKRKSELESQREVIIQEASENSIPSYKSNFYDNLRDILNCSMNDSIGEVLKEDVTAENKSTDKIKEQYLRKMKDFSECLVSIYTAEVSTCQNSSNSLSALNIMKDIKDKLDTILELS